MSKYRYKTTWEDGNEYNKETEDFEPDPEVPHEKGAWELVGASVVRLWDNEFRHRHFWYWRAPIETTEPEAQ